MATLSSVVDINSESITKSYPYNEIEYIDISSVNSGSYDGTKTIALKDAPSRAKRIVKNGDTILATVRPNLRSFLYVKNPVSNAVVSTGFAVLRAKQDKLDSRYLYYTVTTQYFTDYLTLNAKGSAYPAVDAGIIGRAEINLPELPQQKKISGLLGVYDDLIENNLKRIEKLEAMSHLLFNNWYSEYMNKHSDVISVTNLFEIKYGKTLPKTKFKTDGEYPIYGGGGIIGFYNQKTFDEPVCLITSRGNGSGTVWGTIGAAFITNNSFTVAGTVETKGLSAGFIQLLMDKLPIKSALSGSAQPQLTIDSLSHINSPKITYRDAKIVNSQIRNLFNLIYVIQHKNQKLVQARDLLLPQLMTGKIEV